MLQRNIYLASSYTNKLHMREIRDKLVKMGYKVTSRWIDEEHDPACVLGDFSDAELNVMAERDIADIKDADALVHFSYSENLRGGAIAEQNITIGMRYEGRDIRTILVGMRQNVHDYLDMIEYFPTEEEFLAWAEKERKQ
jgi:hypothetical protein